MAQFFVHTRINQRHPDISPEDVIHAWENAIVSAPRIEKDSDEYIALGFDQKGRLLEIVAVRDESGNWLAYHATTPPSEKTYKELRIERG